MSGMRKGEPASGLAFYALLCEDDEFCAELGRAILAAGRLETALNRLISSQAPESDSRQATLGALISVAESNELLPDLVPTLRMIKDQRNYLTHNIHALFSDFIEETILQKSELLDSDVDLFSERAWQLHRNLNNLAEIVEKDTHNQVEEYDA